VSDRFIRTYATYLSERKEGVIKMWNEIIIITMLISIPIITEMIYFWGFTKRCRIDMGYIVTKSLALILGIYFAINVAIAKHIDRPQNKGRNK
jgi:hypothetical protein